MLANSLSAALAKRGIHYGWVVGVVAFVMLLTTAGAMGLPGALILPLNEEFGWGTAAISSALAVRIMLFGLMAPFAAALMNRYGLRNVAIVSTLLICLAFVGAALMREFWQMMLFWGLLVGLASGLTAMVFAATVANRWFAKRRGLIVGLLSASSATGQLVFLPLGAWLVTHMGWRAALLPSGIGVLLAGLLAIFSWPTGRQISASTPMARTVPRHSRSPPPATPSRQRSPCWWKRRGTLLSGRCLPPSSSAAFRRTG